MRQLTLAGKVSSLKGKRQLQPDGRKPRRRQV